MVAALDKPILDQLRPDMDFARTKRPAVTLKLESIKPVHTAQFTAGTAMHKSKLPLRVWF